MNDDISGQSAVTGILETLRSNKLWMVDASRS